MVIAISTNLIGQYSETFIHAQMEQLPGEVVVLGDGYLPRQYSDDRGQTWKELPLVKQPLLKRRSPEEQHRQQVSEFLKRRGVEVVLAQYGLAGIALMPVCASLDIPLAVHFHGFDAYRDDVLEGKTDQFRGLFAASKAIIAVSQDMKNQLSNLGCPEDKLHLVPYGIDTDFFHPGEKQAFANFVACGRFVEKKGPQFTLQAFRKLHQKYPGATLTMIGNGPLFEECSAMVSEWGMDEVVNFPGVLTPEQVRDVYKEAFAFVQHSMRPENNDSEGLPLAILEACACELPVVATRHGGIPDVIEDGVNGFLVDEKDVEAMAACMIQLLEDIEPAYEMGKRGRERVLEHYQLSRYINQLARIIGA